MARNGIMKYLSQNDIKLILVTGKLISIQKGDEFEVRNGFLTTQKGMIICEINSDIVKKAFVYNDDEHGITRNLLISLIINYFNTVDEDYTIELIDAARILKADYSKWLKKPVGIIEFNDEFFRADIDELSEFCQKLQLIN